LHHQPKNKTCWRTNNILEGYVDFVSLQTTIKYGSEKMQKFVIL